jgi:transposase, IS5 family
MITSTVHQPSLFYAAFEKQASLIKDDLLDPIDVLLDDPELIRLVVEAQASAAPCASSRGRTRIAPDRVLRCCALKHIKGWSFRELERELRGSLVYRHFTHFDQDPVPDFSTFSRNLALLASVTSPIHARVISVARKERIATGRKLRTDTTVVETDIHYPTDSTLLQDGIRVLTRAARRIADECRGAPRIVDHRRAVKHRVLEIHRAAKSLAETGRQKLKDGYCKLLGLARGVLRKVDQIGHALDAGQLAVVGNPLRVLGAEYELRHLAPLCRKVIAQTEARVFGGDRHVSDKIVSLFEEHSEVIRKGKTHKPTEFGRLVRIDEVENGIVSSYAVEEGNPPDVRAWDPALDEHETHFGRPPRMATADRGYYSAENERAARARGVERVVLPGRGKLCATRRGQQKERWFQRALRWRAGIENRIATLKHRFEMVRARYKGALGFTRYVGWCVISQNLVSMARVQRRRELKRNAQEARHED